MNKTIMIAVLACLGVFVLWALERAKPKVEAAPAVEKLVEAEVEQSIATFPSKPHKEVPKPIEPIVAPSIIDIAVPAGMTGPEAVSAHWDAVAVDLAGFQAAFDAGTFSPF